MSGTWSAFYDATEDKALHPHLELLRPLLPAAGDAVDLGCGVGASTKMLLDAGLSVTAVDIEVEALDRLRGRLSSGNLTCIKADLATFSPPQVDVAVAQFSLFFLPPHDFDSFWARLVSALRPGGLFSGQFLGLKDDWASRGYAVHNRAQVEDLLTPFEVLHLDEVERDGETALHEPKHWHVFHVIARKR